MDNRVTDTTELKTTGKLPFGQVPLLEMPDVRISRRERECVCESVRESMCVRESEGETGVEKAEEQIKNLP